MINSIFDQGSVLRLFDQKRPNMTVATRDSDGQSVYIKRTPHNHWQCKELEHIRLLLDGLNGIQPANHCTPVIEVFEDQLDDVFSYVVMPFMHDVDPLSFSTTRDVIEFVGQMLLVRVVFLSFHRGMLKIQFIGRASNLCTNEK